MAVYQKIVSEIMNPQKEKQVTNTDNLIAAVEQWASDRKILQHGNAKTQALKLMSEVGELADALAKGDDAGVVDGIGDCTVVLIIIARLHGVPLPLCLAAAYDQIKDRRGVLTKEGVFVKEEPNGL
jgi:NTP pyrophosphatase (non-canonical NTP hydrolase)